MSSTNAVSPPKCAHTSRHLPRPYGILTRDQRGHATFPKPLQHPQPATNAAIQPSRPLQHPRDNLGIAHDQLGWKLRGWLIVWVHSNSRSAVGRSRVVDSTRLHVFQSLGFFHAVCFDDEEEAKGTACVTEFGGAVIDGGDDSGGRYCWGSREGEGFRDGGGAHALFSGRPSWQPPSWQTRQPAI